jgi:hypothetical protein
MPYRAIYLPDQEEWGRESLSTAVLRMVPSKLR